MNFSVEEEKFDLYVPYFRPPPHDGTDDGCPAGYGHRNAATGKQHHCKIGTNDRC